VGHDQTGTPGWIAAAGSPARQVEVLKHLDGDLVIVPRPSTTGERRAEISGRAEADSLLTDQEAVCVGGPLWIVDATLAFEFL
jgi:hypothetical protein